MSGFGTLDELWAARPELAGLTIAEIAFPGALRDRLVGAYLSGDKTAGSSLLAEFELEAAPLPTVGDREIMLDSAHQPVAILAVVDVAVLPLADVDLRVAQAEGEGFTSVAEWRAAHVAFWTSSEMREALGDPAFVPTDATPVVVSWFEVVERFS